MVNISKEINDYNIVSSKDTRENNDKIIQSLGYTYHRTLQLAGKLSFLSTCLNLTSKAMAAYTANLLGSDPSKVVLTSRSEPYLPTAIADTPELIAENHQGYGIVAAKRISSLPVFTDTSGIINDNIRLSFSSNNELFLAPPHKIETNSINHILDDEVPFMVKYIGDHMANAKTHARIFISSRGQNLLINALRIVPMPAIGAVSLECIEHGASIPVVLNNHIPMEREMEVVPQRTFPSYIHFEQLNTRSVNVNLFSDLYSEEENAAILGISRIIGEYNVYAKKSYISYRVPFPQDHNSLVKLQILPDAYNTDLTGISAKIYTSETEFNNMSDSYDIEINDLFTGKIDKDGDYVYILIKITSNNNTTPSIGNIILEFE